jgi:hypothetical protein
VRPQWGTGKRCRQSIQQHWWWSDSSLVITSSDQETVTTGRAIKIPDTTTMLKQSTMRFIVEGVLLHFSKKGVRKSSKFASGISAGSNSIELCNLRRQNGSAAASETQGTPA